MKAAGLPEHASCSEYPKSCVLRMLIRKLYCIVNDTTALIGLCPLMTSPLGQIRDPWHGQFFAIAHIVIGLSLHIHSFIHLS